MNQFSKTCTSHPWIVCWFIRDLQILRHIIKQCSPLWSNFQANALCMFGALITNFTTLNLQERIKTDNNWTILITFRVITFHQRRMQKPRNIDVGFGCLTPTHYTVYIYYIVTVITSWLHTFECRYIHVSNRCTHFILTLISSTRGCIRVCCS